MDRGADAVIVSNHGGRQLDRAPTPLEVLPEVVDAVGDRAEVYVDGGIMSGADVVAAVALRRAGGLVGRAYLYGLMAAGERGVDRAADILRSEVTTTMALLGVREVADLRRDHVRPAYRPEVRSAAWTWSSTRRAASSTPSPSAARAPAMRVKPGTALRLWSDDAFCGVLRSVDDLSSEKVDLRYVNPQTGPFYVEGAEPGDTLVLHLVDLEPARDWGASAAIPFFGGMTSTDRTVTLQEALPDTTWIYELDRDAGTVTFAARHSEHRIELPVEPMLGTVGVAPAGGEVRSLAGAGPVRRQHGHPADAGRRDGLPRRQRRGRAVLDRRRPLPPGRGRGVRYGGRGRDDHDPDRRPGQGRRPGWPRIEDDTHWMTVGSSRPLEDAWRIGNAELVHWVAELYGLHTMDAYQLCSQIAEVPIANVVDANYSVAVKAAKHLLPRASAFDGIHADLRARARSLGAP